mmetsp:Transcript_60087/g.133909  ORF Transcript_60087/g.133909 Transcript_60087/m.133909 type:complete len:247 (+) Transcript_60087:452-1192(+)
MPLSSSSAAASSSRANPLPAAIIAIGAAPAADAATRPADAMDVPPPDVVGLPCIRCVSCCQKPPRSSDRLDAPESYWRRFASLVSTSFARLICLKMSSACKRSTSGSRAHLSGCHRIARRRNTRLISVTPASRFTPRTAYGSSPSGASLSNSRRKRSRDSRSAEPCSAPPAGSGCRGGLSTLYPSPKIATKTLSSSRGLLASPDPRSTPLSPNRIPIRRCASRSATSRAACPLLTFFASRTFCRLR